jgi:hypothetical protein
LGPPKIEDIRRHKDQAPHLAPLGGDGRHGSRRRDLRSQRGDGIARVGCKGALLRTSRKNESIRWEMSKRRSQHERKGITNFVILGQKIISKS